MFSNGKDGRGGEYISMKNSRSPTVFLSILEFRVDMRGWNDYT